MIVIVSKDKDFSHTLAEQVVRELGQACECIDQAADIKTIKSSDIRLIVTRDATAKVEKIPTLIVKARSHMRQTLSDIHQQLKSPDTKDEAAFGNGFIFSIRQKELHHALSGKTASLTDKEAQLLGAIITAGSKGIGKDELLKAVWGFEADLNTHTLETHIYRLRAKCKDLSGSDMISAVEGKYRL